MVHVLEFFMILIPDKFRYQYNQINQFFSLKTDLLSYEETWIILCVILNERLSTPSLSSNLTPESLHLMILHWHFRSDHLKCFGDHLLPRSWELLVVTKTDFNETLLFTYSWPADLNKTIKFIHWYLFTLCFAQPLPLASICQKVAGYVEPT